MLDDIKLKRFSAKFGGLLAAKNASNQSGGTYSEPPAIIDEGTKEHRTPKFVQHCVTAITERPETMAKIKSKKGGSPFAICHAQYNKDKRSLAAKHTGGQHHTVAQYERSLKKLREETAKLRSDRPDRKSIVFEASQEPPSRSRRRLISFEPE